MGRENALSRERYHLIDALRGLALLNMLAFHLCFDIFVVYGGDPSWALLPAVTVWERFICISFILISGVSLNFSRHAYRRGLVVLSCGLLITAVTAVFIPDQKILFGVLSFLGCAMLLTQALRRFWEKVNPFAGAAAALLLFTVFYGMPQGYLGILDIRLWELPGALYVSFPLAVLGLPAQGFSSADFFPLLPWLFLYTGGFFLWRAVVRLKADRFFTVRIPVLGAIGRHTLWIYLLHQPVLMGVCFLIFGKL